MDCPSEETLIRMKLEGNFGVDALDFDIPNRSLTVFHSDGEKAITEAIESLKLGGKLINTDTISNYKKSNDSNQRKLLWWVLLINFGFFLIESITGIISHSMGLIADSLDMLADAFVYGLSLMAVGHSVSRKRNIAKAAGFFQIALAILGFVEVIRRFIGAKELPSFQTMIIVSVLALLANTLCLYLLQQSKGKQEAHMQASMIFTSNDIIINAGVIIAGLLVYITSSVLPDLIVGTIVFLLVLQGAFRILKLSK